MMRRWILAAACALLITWGHAPVEAATTWLQIENGAEGTLSASVSDSATSFVLDTGQGAGFPASGDFHLTINDTEIVKCTARTTDTLTVTRAQEGTAATAHALGATVSLNVSKAYLTQYGTAINGIENGTTTLTSVTTSGAATVGTDLLVDGGDVGITADADLLGLAANALTVRGTLAVTGATATLSGDLLVNGGDVGITADADLLGLASGALTVRGTSTVTGDVTFSSDDAYFGVSDSERGWLQIYSKVYRNATATAATRCRTHAGAAITHALRRNSAPVSAVCNTKVFTHCAYCFADPSEQPLNAVNYRSDRSCD